MHDRQVAVINNKKCYMSSDYIRKIINTYRGRNILNSNTNINDILLKIDSSKNIDISKEQPLILFNRLKKRNIIMENQIKKELMENQGLLNNAAIKKNLIGFYSQNLSKESLLKNKTQNLFKYPLSTKKNRKARNNLNTNSELFQSIQSMDAHRKKLQKEYSNSIRARLRSSLSKKHKKDGYVGTENVSLKRKNTMDKLSNDILTDKKFVEKLMTKKVNNGISNNITQRKKEFLEMNNISYENTDVKEIENEKNNEKEKKRRVKLFKDGKYINSINKKENEKYNKKNIAEEKKGKKIKEIKCNIDAFEYINKIQKEIKNLKIVSNK